MANPSKGLGRGLAALLGDDVMTPEEEKTSLYLPISQVESCASQPRKQFDPDALADLADSIREHGIIQPLTVRKLQSGYYQIIAGERRWRAARMAGLSEVPAIVIEADDRKAMELAMIENLQREDLNPMEEAEGYQTLMQQYNMTQEETAQRVGKSRSAVANAMRLLNLPENVLELLKSGFITIGHAKVVLGLPTPELQEEAAQMIADNQLNVRQAEALCKKLAKPAVPFGGKYRIIDFPLSNCANSGIDTVGVLTQYQPLLLNRYIGSGQAWDLDSIDGGVYILPPYQSAGERGSWFSGTANAIYQNMDFIEMYDPDCVLILSGDHVYKMDYDKMHLLISVPLLFEP